MTKNLKNCTIDTAGLTPLVDRPDPLCHFLRLPLVAAKAAEVRTLLPQRFLGAALLLAAGVALASLSSPVRAAPPAAAELPTGGKVVAGQATIGQGVPAQLDIRQSSDRAAIDWATFNVGKDAQVKINQPSANSVLLNRVQDSQASQIFGRIQANGQVFLSNPHGVYFAPGSSVDVGGLVATSHRISLDDFMAGKARFDRAGSTGSVINEGELRAALGGYIALLAPEVRNLGVIVAQAGTVALAAGESIELRLDGGKALLGLSVSASQIQALVENRHAVLAPGGLIILSAQAANRLQAGVVRNSGRLSATGLVNKGGRIVLDASDRVENSGRVDASAGAVAGAKAGSVEISAPEIVNSGAIVAQGSAEQPSGGQVLVNAGSFTQTATGQIDVSAPSQGGQISIEARGHIDVAGALKVTATADQAAASPTTTLSQGGTVSVIAVGAATLADATVDASGGQGGRVQLEAGANAAALRTLAVPLAVPATVPVDPTAPTSPRPTPGQLALLGNTSVATRGRKGHGGDATLLGDHIHLNDHTALDASGATGGGNVLVGGDWQGSNGVRQATTVAMTDGATIDASATVQGDGGKVVLWSDVHNVASDTTVSGSVLARGAGTGHGGQVETSGHQITVDGFRADTRSPQGALGLWLIDPYDYTIGATQAGNISAALNTSDIVITTTASATNYGGSAVTGTGNITVNSAIASTGAGAGALTLDAQGSVVLNAGITLTGTNKALTIKAAANIATTNTAKTLTTNNGNILLWADSGAVGTGQLDADFTVYNPGSGNVTFRSHTVLWTSGGSYEPTINGTGTFTWESSAASFGQAVDLAWLTVAPTMSGLTVGKATNTQAVNVTRAVSVAGPISLYGGDINLSANLSSTASGGGISILAQSNIGLTSSLTLTTGSSSVVGGNILLASDTNGDGAGSIYFRTGALTVNSYGGNITFGGGNNTGSGYAINTSNNTLNSGIELTGPFTLNSSGNATDTGGTISLRGKSAGNYSGIRTGGTFLINSGTEKVVIEGTSTGGHGVAFAWDASGGTVTPNYVITSAYTGGTAISVTGTTAGSGAIGTHLAFGDSGNMLFQSTGANGGVSLIGNSTTGRALSSVNSAANVLNLQVISQGGNIVASGTGGGDYDVFLLGQSYFGDRLNSTAVNGITPSVTGSTANISILSDKTFYDRAAVYSSTGAYTFAPTSSAFAAGVTWNGTLSGNDFVAGSGSILHNANGTTTIKNFANITGLTLGKAGNTADITLASATTVNLIRNISQTGSRSEPVGV